YFYIHEVWICIAMYAIFQGCFAPAMPQMYASARVSINTSTSKDRAKVPNAVLRSMFSFGFLFGPLIVALLVEFKEYAGLFSGTITIILITLLLQVVFFKDTKTKRPVADSTHVEAAAPNMLRDKVLFVPFLAFILLHIGQWMYTLNMPLYVTNYLKEPESRVGVLASICAGLEVPFMVILGILSAKLTTRTLLLLGGLFGGLFYFSIGVFNSIV